MRGCDVQIATNWPPAERSFERLEENAGVPDEEFHPERSATAWRQGVPCLLPDLERRDTRPSRARREAGAGYDQISRSDRTSLTTRLAAASPKNDQGPGFGGLSRGAIAPCRYVTTSGGNGSVQALGDYEDLSVNNDGSLDLYIQSDAPEADREANWLPVAKAPFILLMRLYSQKAEFLTRSWSPPLVQRIN